MKTTAQARLPQACIGLIILSLMLVSAGDAQIDAEAVVGIWPFDEKEGQVAKDRSGNGNHGKLKNGPQWVESRIGSGLRFDGVDDYVDCGNDASLNTTDAITVMAWMMDDAQFGSEVSLVSRYDAGAGDRSWAMTVQQGKLRVQLSDDGSFADGHRKLYESSTTVSEPVTWHHVAFTFGGSTGKLTLYVDGEEDDSNKILDDAIRGLHSSGVNLLIGAGQDSGKPFQHFNGRIDEVFIFDRALSPGEIIKAVSGDHTCACPPAIAIGGVFDPLELGQFEDPLELGVLEDPFEIGILERPLELPSGATAAPIGVWVFGWDIESVEQVYVTITPPNQGSTAPDTRDVELIELEPASRDIYVTEYNQFIEAGDYTVTAFAETAQGTASPVQTIIRVSPGVTAVQWLGKLTTTWGTIKCAR